MRRTPKARSTVPPDQISWISFQDVARFAVTALKSPRAKNAVIQLGGPRALESLEASIREQSLAKAVSRTARAEETLRAQYDSATIRCSSLSQR